MQRTVLLTGVFAILLAGSACEVIDRARGRGGTADTAAVARQGGLTLGMQTPGALRPGDEGVVRLAVTNRGDTTAQGLRLELHVPGWLEPSPPRLGDREVSMAATEEHGTRFAYRLEEEPLEPEQTQTVEQRIRVPAGGPLTEGALPGSRRVLARLIGPGGQLLSEVESEIAMVGAGAQAAASGDTAGPSPQAAAQGRDRLGPVRLGMTGTELRGAAPGTRDTAWSQEGTRERGVVVPLGSAGRALAVLSGDTVTRIEVRTPDPRTREGMGVGSRLEELRAAYGRPCMERAEGRTVVRFARAPGISFGLDAPGSGQSAESLPGDARVTSWWVARGAEGCP